MASKILGNLTQLSETLQKIERGAKAVGDQLEPLAKDIASLPDHLRNAIASEVFAEVAKHFVPAAKESAKTPASQNGKIRPFYGEANSTGNLVSAYLATNPGARPTQIYHGIKEKMRPELQHKKQAVHSTLRYLRLSGKVAHDAETGEYRIADPKPETQS